ncbi:hypothetical protein [Niveibacterium sp. SC-1]|uniref:alginate O-acetyltransferase AlgX-related protein n=1 Tax=Niveibacterium sp. SC-1 TaxID=3135646 RepID=UPI00311E7695
MSLKVTMAAERYNEGEGWRFWLDLPQVNRAIDTTQGSLEVRGWMVTPEGDVPRHVLVRDLSGSGPVALPLSVKRPDVLRRVLSVAEPEGHGSLVCGFGGPVPMPAEGFELGCEVDGRAVWLQRYAFAEASMALQGRNGWLFLDNDTNGSVDQHTGRQLIDAAQLNGWRAYLDGAQEAAGRFGFRHVLAVVPSKEQVLEEHYPHARGAETPVDQLAKLAGDAEPVLFLAPWLRLQVPRDAQFMKTDTHWTDRGARVGALECVRALGLPVEQAAPVLEADRFKVVDYEGDLGGKVLPAVKAPTEFLDAPHIWSLASFDNLLPNFGHVAVFASPDAPWQETLVVFGSSSAVQMLRYLHRLFRRLVFVHGAGSISREVLAHERPAYVLLQTNARFIVQAPSADFDLRKMVAGKLAETSGALKERIALAASAVGSDSLDAFYAEMLG